MSRARTRYTESDMRRILSAAAKVGVNVRVVIEPDGKIVVVSGPSSEATTRNPWDEVLEGASAEQKRAS